jgi:hypothetical protein
MELELKHLTAYLPYDLKCNVMGESKDDYAEPKIPKIFEIVGLTKDYVEYWKEGSTVTEQCVFSDCFPLLRPISSLVKEIEFDGKKFIPIEAMFLPCGERKLLESWAKENKCWLGQQLSYLPYQMLFAMNFDIFNLCENELAINLK